MATIPAEVLVWTFGCKPGKLRSQNQYSTANVGNGYSMHCRTNGQFLTYKDTNFGISLGYKTAEECKTHFRLPDESEREILTGEKVALGIGGGRAFLYYAQRTVGINLDWSSLPKFEWLLFDETGEKVKPIPIGSLVAIINERVEPQADFLIHFDRTAGADVGWTSSPGQLENLTDFALKVLDVVL